jgi:3-hydroxyisobutyrate dehydrogenase-like beta-hydroxyacid dehydrogenase
MREKKIGFVGLGLMGSGMTKNLLAAGFPVLGYDLDRGKMDDLRRAGGQITDTPDQIAGQVDVILLSLPNSTVVNEVVQSALKLFDTGKKGQILIDTTTADPILSEELALRLRGKGIDMLDATASGTSKMCAAKDIIFMVGGQEETFKNCMPIFSAMAKEALFMGKNGAGALTKIIVNLVLGLNRMALAEGLSLAKKAQMDQHRMLEVLKKSAAYSKAMDQKGTIMIEKKFLPAEGKVSSALKDRQLMLDLGKRLSFPLPLVAIHAQALAAEVAKGRGDWDSAAIISFYEESGNL